jgi:hypothetical protein
MERKNATMFQTNLRRMAYRLAFLAARAAVHAGGIPRNSPRSPRSTSCQEPPGPVLGLQTAEATLPPRRDGGHRVPERQAEGHHAS